MSELTEWLRKESNRNALLQGEKNHTNHRRKVFRRRNHMLMDAANKIEGLQAQLNALRPYLKHTPECLMVESHDYSPCTCGLTAALNGEDDGI